MNAAPVVVVQLLLLLLLPPLPPSLLLRPSLTITILVQGCKLLPMLIDLRRSEGSSQMGRHRIMRPQELGHGGGSVVVMILCKHGNTRGKQRGGVSACQSPWMWKSGQLVITTTPPPPPTTMTTPPPRNSYDYYSSSSSSYYYLQLCDHYYYYYFIITTIMGHRHK